MIEIIIAILATYGISKLLTSYDGVYDVFLRLRSKYPNSALQCAVCTSCYVVVPVFIVFILGLSIWLLPFAIVGVIILIEEII